MTGTGTPSESLLNAALHLLAPRRRGVEELRGRLLKRGFPPTEVSQCLIWLEERDLLDDEAFALALARDRLRFSPRSPALLERELVLKGIASALARDAVHAAMEEEGVSDRELAGQAAGAWVRKQGASTRRALLQSRFTSDRERARRRLHAFLSRRGFRGEAARIGMEAGECEARNLFTQKD